MALPKIFRIKESEGEIRKLIKSNNTMIGKRLHALLVFKQHEQTGISKRAVADHVGVDQNSVQTWRTVYIDEGIKGLMTHANTGYKPSKINSTQEKALKKKLGDPSNGMVGFSELLDWFNAAFKTTINYKTFHGFVVRKFKAKIKTARKSHVKKDQASVDAFKKTSANAANKSSPQINRTIKR
jgi:transposase